jgi:hypothetical protein
MTAIGAATVREDMKSSIAAVWIGKRRRGKDYNTEHCIRLHGDGGELEAGSGGERLHGLAVSTLSKHLARPQPG